MRYIDESLLNTALEADGCLADKQRRGFGG